MPFPTVLLNKKTALLVKEVYKRLAEQKAYPPSQTFFYTYINKLDKYLVYYDIGQTAEQDEAAVFSSEVSKKVHHSLMMLNGILAQTGALNAEETVGMELLRQAMEFRYEKYDGTGQPGHFTGEQIPPVAKMLPVCELIASAMLKAEPLSGVTTRLERASGKEFDPLVVKTALQVAEQSYADEKEWLERYQSEQPLTMEMTYSPVMDCHKHRVMHYAGRLVLNDPKQGTIQPEVYVPVAEKNGRMATLTQMGLEQLCAAVAMKKYDGTAVRPLALSVSHSCLRKKSFMAAVKKIIGDYQIDPSFVMFQVAETALAYEDDETKRALHQLKDMGIGVILDRFGAEYASLAKLKEWEFTWIRLDPTFAESVTEDHKAYEIIKSMLQLAESLGMELIVTGVDHKKQKELLTELGCRYMQGESIREPQ